MRGDSRGWVDRDHNQVGSNYRSPRPPLLESDRKRMAEPSFSLSRKSRKLAAEACSRTCQDRSWILVALHVRTSHLHAIVRAATTPGRVLAVLKSCATKRLRAHGPYRTRYWARGGSKKYLWNPRQISVAIDYVLNCQGGGNGSGQPTAAGAGRVHRPLGTRRKMRIQPRSAPGAALVMSLGCLPPESEPEAPARAE